MNRTLIFMSCLNYMQKKEPPQIFYMITCSSYNVNVWCIRHHFNDVTVYNTHSKNKKRSLGVGVSLRNREAAELVQPSEQEKEKWNRKKRILHLLVLIIDSPSWAVLCQLTQDKVIGEEGTLIEKTLREIKLWSAFLETDGGGPRAQILCKSSKVLLAVGDWL